MSGVVPETTPALFIRGQESQQKQAQSGISSLNLISIVLMYS